MSQDTKKSAGDASRNSSPEPKELTTSKPGTRNAAGLVPGPVDPPWLRLDLFPGATVKTTGRSAPDAAGLFSTQILYELAEGTTVEACVSTVKTAVADAVPELSREEGKDGRITLKGKTANYAMVAVCGVARGKPTAYVSYEWLTAPPL